MARYDLSQVERLIDPLLPNKPCGVARVDDGRVNNGIFYVLQTGSLWRDLPSRYGPRTTVYNRFNRWAKAGVRLRVFEALAAGQPGSVHLIDSAIIQTRQNTAGQVRGADHAIARSRGRLSTRSTPRSIRTPAAADRVSAGKASDKSAVEALIDGPKPARELVADRGNDARAIVGLIAARGGCAHIPTQGDRKVQCSIDPAIYRQRNVVKQYFRQLKDFRRIATRFDKLAGNFLAAVLLASTRLWLRDYESRT